MHHCPFKLKGKMYYRFVRLLTLALFLGWPGVRNAQAGAYEISANGSFYKYDNGVIAGDSSVTTIRRMGGGISYSFLESTALEVSYSDTRNTDTFSQISRDQTLKWQIERVTRIQNLSLDLVIGFSERQARFRPYIRGGGGYTVRATATNGVETDLTDNGRADLKEEITESESVTAQAGTGFKYYLADRVALEFSYTIFASELDQPTIYMHHSVAGGLRIVF